MKTYVLALAFLLPITAHAFDFETTVALLDEANYTCFSGENHDGEAVSESQIKSACLDTVAYLRLLESNGYCYDQGNYEWRECKDG